MFEKLLQYTINSIKENKYHWRNIECLEVNSSIFENFNEC